MKSHIVCTLVLFQIVSIYGASGGYKEYRSPLNIKGNKSKVVDFAFTPLGDVLDWADLACGIVEEVHAVVLAGMQPNSLAGADVVSEPIKSFIQVVAPLLLRNLRRFSETDSSDHEREDLSVLRTLGLSSVSLLCRLTCANVPGAVHVCCEPTAKPSIHYQTKSCWQASAHIKDGRPFFMGSADPEAAKKGVESLLQDAAECDLHSLIFHRMPTKVLQDQ